MQADGRISAHTSDIGTVMTSEESGADWRRYHEAEYDDDLSGEKLNPELAKQAREEEMTEVKSIESIPRYPQQSA